MIKKELAKAYTNFFRVLSDPTRLNIIMLLTAKELCVCQIEMALGVHQAKISRHLAYLRKHNIVQVRREWKWKYYSLARPKNQFEENILQCLKKWLQKEKIFKSVFFQMKECLAQSLDVVAQMAKKLK
ncbi:MAG: metalloregulator ArsR/SmtB family transcription factor [Candidatus Omnitrophica bacterium]|nr:metalloregulator ArsR/SmtB family transcription factor [Candidatus Omnitrophota bacterium]